MCGFAGFLSFRDIGEFSDATELLKVMGEAIAHRGPDSDGFWIDRNAGVGMVHRRLSIVDLSEAGHQPMISLDERYILVFNGEIYNNISLRNELERAGYCGGWRGHSDTETLLAGFVVWGVEDTLKRCIGMFAIALWDRRDRVLILTRDRMGEKPIYYGWFGVGNDRTFLFGSEVKALRHHPDFNHSINRDSIVLLMRHSYIPAPHSIYSGLKKLLPGTILRVSLERQDPDIGSYWSLVDAVRNGLCNKFSGSAEDAIEKLDELARDAVLQQMTTSDVPLGAFLSGGIDSSTIVSLMQAQSIRPIKTFTIGFDEEGYNEAVHAKEVAKYLGTDHTELYVSAKQAMDVIPKINHIYGEPFSDSSQIPTYLVSALARSSVTVSLSGDAGDELFGGYSRYFKSDKIWSAIGRCPKPLRSVLSGVARSQLNNARVLNGKKLGGKINKFVDLMSFDDPMKFYQRCVTHWAVSDGVLLGGVEPYSNFRILDDSKVNIEFFESMMLVDSVTYLPDDILTKVDRAAMAVSLETRVPFLDHRLVEFAWSLPLSMKIKNGQGKWILRELLYKYVPKNLIDRPKMGFGVPIGAWLRGPLREWAENLINEDRLRKEGYFRHDVIRRKWADHLSGNYNWQYHLWDVLMFQAWLDEQ